MKKNYIIVCLIVIIIIVILTIIAVLIYNANNKESRGEIITISEKEKNLEKVQIDTKNKSEEEVSQEILNNIVTEKVLVEESKNRGSELTAEEVEQARKMAYDNEIKEENLSKIADMGMTETEFREFFYEEMKKTQIVNKFKRELMSEISKNEVRIDNEEFKNKVNEYHEQIKNENYDLELFSKLVDEYVELLKKDYTIVELDGMD